MGTFVLVVMFSTDGLSWHFSSEVAYNTTVRFQDGQVVEFKERPERLFDEAGQVTHLVTGDVFFVCIVGFFTI